MSATPSDTGNRPYRPGWSAWLALTRDPTSSSKAFGATDSTEA
jgi:hypothetical protein